MSIAPVDLAALVQSRTLAILLQALQPAQLPAGGGTVEAKLLAVEPGGKALAQIGATQVSLLLQGPDAAAVAKLTPGAILVLNFEKTEPGAPAARATLVEARPAAAGTPPPASPDDTAPQATARQPVLMPETAATPARQAPAALPAQAAPTAQATPAHPSQLATASPAALADPGRPLANPRQIAGPLLGPALARQDSLAPLFADLKAVAATPLAALVPRPVLARIEAVLAQALRPEARPVTATVLREAVARSGLLHEAVKAVAPEGASATRPAAPDLKAALVALRDILLPRVDRAAAESSAPSAAKPPAETTQPAIATLANASRPEAPRPGGALQPQPPIASTLTAADPPPNLAATLLDRTEAALDRITLGQYLSLPPDATSREANAPQRWHAEIPVAFATGTAVMPLQIEREPPQRDGTATAATGPLWRLRFALDVEPDGPLQGLVTLRGRQVGVTLWAEREATGRTLRGAASDLEAALAQASFEGAVEIRSGRPPVRQTTAGQYLDRRS